MRIRLTGISTPIVGISWEYKDRNSEKQIARNLITFLEDRRVLFSDIWGKLFLNSPGTPKSVQEIRDRLNKDIENLDRTSNLAQSLLFMRKACRDFLDAYQLIKDPDCESPVDWDGADELIEKFRKVFISNMIQISSAYEFELEIPEDFPRPSNEDLKEMSEESYWIEQFARTLFLDSQKMTGRETELRIITEQL